MQKSQLEFGQGFYNAAGFEGEGDDALDEVEDVARVAVFVAPEVGVVDDAALFVGRHLVALHDPLDRGFAVDNILVMMTEKSLVTPIPGTQISRLSRTADRSADTPA